MLHIKRRINVDSGRQQFLDILPTLGMAAATLSVWASSSTSAIAGSRRIASTSISESITLVFYLFPRNDFETFGERLGFRSAVSYHDANNNIDARLLPSASLTEHLVGLAHAGSRAEEDFETAALLLRRRLQQRFR